jgi:predicted acylesterase/phospholipase RssA
MRSLILAGGGLKIGYQAGCLQVLLDEVGLTFDHVDAASGGCFNAALLANGYSGTEIAQTWRDSKPAEFFRLNWNGLFRGLWSPSIGDSRGIRTIMRDRWKLDFNKIRAQTYPIYTFNVFDFTLKQVLIKEQSELTEDLLVACVSLVMWFQPVQIDNHIMFDAVYCRDANVGEAIRRGADEIWAIWTVADRSDYRPGFLAQYFHIIEAAADGRFKEEWREIARVNAAIDAVGEDSSRHETDLMLFPGDVAPAAPPPGRKRVTQHLIQQEVPVQYVVIFGRDRMAESVNAGITDARAYCLERGLLNRSYVVPAPGRKPVGFGFSETMSGSVKVAESVSKFTFKLKIATASLDDLLLNPDHRAEAVGTVMWAPAGITPRPVEEGSCQLLVSERAPDGREVPQRKRFIYRLRFSASDGTPYLLYGEKILPNGSGTNPWRDTTTLFTTLSRLAADGTAEPLGEGTLRLGLLAFLNELTTFRVTNVGAWGAVRSIVRFFVFFLGRTWDVYARWIIEYAPY